MTHTVTRATLALALALAAPAFTVTPAHADGSPTTDLTKIQGGHFALDRNHAKILFSLSHFGFSTYWGLFADFDAHLTFDPSLPTKSALDVTVALPGVTTTNPKLDTHLKSPDFFDVARFPTATFKSTTITVTGANTGTVTGALTLHGVTLPVTLETTFNGGGVNPLTKAYVLGFSATTHIQRSAFGISTYVPMVGDDVTLTISGEFDRQP